MLGKKGKGKRFIKNWRMISLLNTDMKIISKVLLIRKKNVLLPFQIERRMLKTGLSAKVEE